MRATAGSFERPANLWLCILSVLWIVVGGWYAVSFGRAGNILGAMVMAVFAMAALGLWFQSRVAAWILIAFASAGIIYALFGIGHNHWYRTAGKLCWAVWGIYLLAEFLSGENWSKDNAEDS